MTARYIVGDVREVLAAMPDSSVDLILTSPPFLALRSYLPADHPDKHFEIGSEATPGEFIDTLLDLTEEWARVLTPHGSLCVELGDTYSGSGGAGGDYNNDGWRDGQNEFVGSGLRNRGKKRADLGAEPPERCARGDGWPEAKSLCLIPQSYAWALAYGRNPFTGRATDPWRVRNIVRWCRPNPPVGALGDKFRPATSEMVVACKSRTRWFDLDAVRGPYSENTHARTANGVESQERTAKTSPDGNRATLEDRNNDGAGAPPLDWWEIPTQPYAGSHYATWPEKLCVRPIDAMCPRSVCTTCGEPRRRLVDVSHEPNRSTNGPQSIDRKHSAGGSAGFDQRADRVAVTFGWSDCGHNTWRRGITLDPFAGSGTTLKVAEHSGRDSVGIDLDARNAELAADRVGMFLTVEHHQREVA